jgi:CHAT domain-containing protein
VAGGARRVGGESFAPPPGTRAEVTAIARLFPRAQTLLGPEASEQRLAELAAAGRLRACPFLHLATHAVIDSDQPMQSALILAPARPGEGASDGRLTAGQIMRGWRLDADLVTLSACQTALGQEGGGEGYIGFSQTLFLAGARSVVLSLWEVDDTATALLMTRFYENLLGRRPGLRGPLPKVAALQEAKRWLRGLTFEEADELRKRLPGLARGKVRAGNGAGATAAAHPFEDPYYWAAFVLIGEPGDWTPEEGGWVGGEVRAVRPAELITPLVGLALMLAGLSAGQTLRRRAARAA